MADVTWAKNFFDKVTSTLPDLLTKHGEGGELKALDELRATLGKERAEADAAKVKELEKQLARMKGEPAPEEEKKAPLPNLEKVEAAAEAKTAKAEETKKLR